MATVLDTPKPARRSCCGAGLLVFFGLLPVLLYLLLAAAGALLIVGDSLRKADFVVLLGGGDSQRTAEAVQIYSDKLAGLLILTETGETDPKSGELYSKLQEEEAIAMGVPRGGIAFTPLHGNSTYEEAKAVRDLAGQSDRTQAIIVVTDPYHTFRTRLIYREVFGDSDVRVMVRPVRNHWYRSTTWWMSRAGWERTISEYVKIFAYLAGVKSD